MVLTRTQKAQMALQKKDLETLKKAGGTKVTTKTAGSKEKGTTKSIDESISELSNSLNEGSKQTSSSVSKTPASTFDPKTESFASQAMLDKANSGASGINPELAQAEASAVVLPQSVWSAGTETSNVRTFAQSFKEGFTKQATAQDRVATGSPAEIAGYTSGLLTGIASQAISGKLFAQVSTRLASVKLFSQGISAVDDGAGVISNVAKSSNVKIVKESAGVLSKVFSKESLAVAGRWAAAVFIGQWAQAESPEPLSVVLTKYLVPNAMQTGDWSLVEQAQSARDEILDLNKWEELVLWSPLSPLVGIRNKIKGSIEASKAQDAVISDMRLAESNGKSFSDLNSESYAKSDASKKEITDYYNTQRKSLLEWEAEARRNERIEEANFWADYSAKQKKAEAADREASAAFWLNYRKQLLKFQDDSRPSNLKFGLL